jgi:hypothetical protein
MRFTYVIRTINYWFARVVYERDSWDLSLERTARNTDWRIAIVLHTARGCVWLTRRILQALMYAGTAISCFMLRQMEFDADSYEAKLAGSQAFASTTLRLAALDAASTIAYQDIRQSWASSRLPANLPRLIDHRAGSLPPEVHQQLSAAHASAKTRWFDTHPCPPERIQTAARLNEPGVFHLTDPAAGLFSDFPALSQRVTRHHYEKDLELTFTEENLIPEQEFLRESRENANTDAVIKKYCGSVSTVLAPFLATGDLPAIGDPAEALASWRSACQSARSLRSEAEQVCAERLPLEDRLITVTVAHSLARAGFSLNPVEFGLPASATSPGDAETTARWALEETKNAIAERTAKLTPFMLALRHEVTLALQLSQAPGIATGSTDPRAVAEDVRLLAAVDAEMASIREIGQRLKAFVLLAQNRSNHADPAQVDGVLSELAAQVQPLLDRIQEHLQNFTYPFPHARGRVTVAEYARSEEKAQNDVHATFLNAHTHAERLCHLQHRLLGRVLSHCNAAELSLESNSADAAQTAAP